MRKSALIFASLLFLCGCAGGSDLSDIRNIHTASGKALVCFGDSLTVGQGARPGDDYPSILRRKLDLPVVNLGSGGDTTQQALARVDEVFKHDPKIVIVEFGANDYIRALGKGFGEMRKSRDEAFDNLRKVVDRIQGYGAVVVIAGVSLNEEYDEGYKKLARETHSVLIPDILEGIYGDQNLMFADSRHPNSKGYRKMAEKIFARLQPLLSEIGSY